MPHDTGRMRRLQPQRPQLPKGVPASQPGAGKPQLTTERVSGIRGESTAAAAIGLECNVVEAAAVAAAADKGVL